MQIKLEIAFREATEFHEALQQFVEWLTNAEKYLTTLKPVSRHMKSVLEQIDEHRVNAYLLILIQHCFKPDISISCFEMRLCSYFRFFFPFLRNL